jgi:hypothetical protein
VWCSRQQCIISPLSLNGRGNGSIRQLRPSVWSVLAPSSPPSLALPQRCEPLCWLDTPGLRKDQSPLSYSAPRFSFCFSYCEMELHEAPKLASAVSTVTRLWRGFFLYVALAHDPGDASSRLGLPARFCMRLCTSHREPSKRISTQCYAKCG